MLEHNEQQALEVIKSQAAAIYDKAQEISIVASPESEARAVNFLGQVKARLEIAEEARTRLVKPLNDHVKMINAEFKKTTGPLAQANDLVRDGIIAYRNSDAFKAAENARVELEAQARIAAREGDIETLQDIAKEHREASALAPKTVETKSGQARFRKVWKYEIESENALPDFFWQPNDKLIKATVEAGQPIPGVKAWQVEVPSIY